MREDPEDYVDYEDFEGGFDEENEHYFGTDNLGRRTLDEEDYEYYDWRESGGN